VCVSAEMFGRLARAGQGSRYPVPTVAAPLLLRG